MLERLIGPFHTSPLGLVPKSGSAKLRMIQDLSFPHGDSACPSVNSQVNSDDFPTEWGTFDSLSSLILGLPAGCKAAAFDITAAYRITPVLPSQQHVLCVFWKGKVYIDRAVCFGLSSSAGVFGAIADMLVDICQASGFGPIRKWVDDFFVVQLPGQHWTTDDFIQTTATLGVPWSHNKTKPLATTQRYLGFDWNLATKSVSFPNNKLSALRALLSTWLDPHYRATSHDAARLHGKLVHASTIFPIIRPFLRSASQFAAKFQSSRAHLHPPTSLRSDIQWTLDLLQRMPNQLPLAPSDPCDLGWWGDASTSFGIGVVVEPLWAAWTWAPGFIVGPQWDFDIGWAEAVAVELGLHLAIKSGQVPGNGTQKSRFLVRSDNMGIVATINKGRSRSRQSNTVIKRIFTELADRRISLLATYVPSAHNVADALSRGDMPAFLRDFPTATTHFPMPLPPALSGKLQSWSSTLP